MSFVAGVELGLRDDGNDGQGDEVPLPIHLDRHHRLDVEDVLPLLLRPVV
jgi:hypothetical protein